MSPSIYADADEHNFISQTPADRRWMQYSHTHPEDAWIRSDCDGNDRMSSSSQHASHWSQQFMHADSDESQGRRSCVQQSPGVCMHIRSTLPTHGWVQDVAALLTRYCPYCYTLMQGAADSDVCIMPQQKLL
eukprot:m.1194175 g.1194175  ORF g.1194175 m.1194175 type:complete len:132 (+) comp24561_c0_seq2:2077-2472(+)